MTPLQRAAQRWESPKNPPLLLEWWGEQLQRDELLDPYYTLKTKRARKLYEAAQRWENPPGYRLLRFRREATREYIRQNLF
jgi:hypothetical protein